jgi:hypothetical protein
MDIYGGSDALVVAATTADERKRMLAAIFDSITASAEGVNRLEPCEAWRPYVVAAIPQPVAVRGGGLQSGRRDSMCPMLKQPGSCGTSADGSDLRADANGN